MFYNLGTSLTTLGSGNPGLHEIASIRERVRNHFKTITNSRQQGRNKVDTLKYKKHIKVKYLYGLHQGLHLVYIYTKLTFTVSYFQYSTPPSNLYVFMFHNNTKHCSSYSTIATLTIFFLSINNVCKTVTTPISQSAGKSGQSNFTFPDEIAGRSDKTHKQDEQLQRIKYASVVL
jgi:hypothetical protein